MGAGRERRSNPPPPDPNPQENLGQAGGVPLLSKGDQTAFHADFGMQRPRHPDTASPSPPPPTPRRLLTPITSTAACLSQVCTSQLEEGAERGGGRGAGRPKPWWWNVICRGDKAMGLSWIKPGLWNSKSALRGRGWKGGRDPAAGIAHV